MSGPDDFLAICERERAAIAAQIAAKLELPDHERAGVAARLELVSLALRGDWEPYRHALRAMGEHQAAANSGFSLRIASMTAFQAIVTPLLIEAYGAEPARLAAALESMHELSNRAMSIMIEAYLGAKQRQLSAVEKLSVDEARFRQFVESVQDYAIIMLDPLGRVMSWSVGAERMLGWRADEILGRHFGVFFAAEDLAAGHLERELKAVLTDGDFQEEGWRLRKDGTRFWASVVITAVRNDQGNFVAFGKVIRDHTERRRILSLLEERNHAAERASRAKSEFLAMMSHELRTPLNSIIGFSEVLIDQKVGALNEKQARYLSNVHMSGRHLLGLINDLLDLSKVEAGRMDVMRQPCAARALVAEAAATLKPLASAGQLTVEIDGSDAAPVDPVQADPARLKQVLYNLLSNAIKFSPPGATVRVCCAPSPRAGHLRITVADRGPGIAASDLAALFTPFAQLDQGRRQGGTGLGLALSKQLVELMHGRIGVESTVGVGSEFFIELPIAEAEPATPTAPETRAGEPLALIIDDEAESRELLALALSTSGYRILVATSGEEALALARQQRPDVITLDIFLPTIDGWDVLRLLRSDPRTSAIPVVVVSISSDRGKAFSLGAVEHLVKPVGREALLAALARHSFTTKVKSAPVHVLAIDDDAKQLELYRAALEPHGFRLRTESSARAGIEAALREKTDLLLLDLVMPELSGVEVVARLRADERTRTLPIILVTAHELGRDDRARLNDDLAAVLAKGSMQIGDLLAEIRRVLPRR